MHVQGSAQYIDDIAVPDGTLHVAFALSNVAHGKIKSIDVNAARVAEGVHSVLLADEIENLDESEKEQLKGSIKELIMEGPKTSLAISRYKKLMGKAGKFAYEEMKTLIVEIVSSTVKKSLFD